MDIAVPSRFACLKIEDDDFRPSGHSKKKPDTKQTKNPNSAAKEASKSSWTATRKKGNNNEIKLERPKSAINKKAKQKQREENDKDWEEWQKKDAKFVNEEFEQQMQSAILQSKLDFEQQKKSGVIKTEPEPSHGKKKKGKTMSLDQFLETNKESDVKEEPKMKDNVRDFFDEVFETAKKEITKEKVEQNRKKRQETFEEVISLAQCQEKLEAERAKNAILEKELEEARHEIALVKKRNTTLCSMLSQGEMKDKAEVLLELERLTHVKEELTEEVSKLHKLLEQERSNKNSANTNSSDVHAKHSKEKIKKKKH